MRKLSPTRVVRPSPAGTAPGAAGLEPPIAQSPTDVPRPPAAAPGRPGSLRYPALDGLRGMAALVVLVFHVLLLFPTFNNPDPATAPADPSWWFTHTPLALVWAGPQAVFLFFVLSGFVLALPATRGAIRWRAYYPQRLLRLYLPVWGSIVLAVVLTLLVPRVPHENLSQWYAREDVAPLSAAAHDAVLLLGTGRLNSALWSLRWEVLFSLLLPLYLLGARLFPRLWWLKFAGLFGLLIANSALQRASVLYLSMFAFGVLLAFERERVASAARRVSQWGAAPWPLVAGAAVLFLTVETLLFAAGAGSTSLLDAVAVTMQVAGACLAVVLALHWGPLRRAMCTPWVQWVGVRSFSLYLVHEPLVVSLAALWPRLPVLAHLVLGVAVSLVVAHVFHRLVEGPAHRLSRRAGAWAGGGAARGDDDRRVATARPPRANLGRPAAE